MAEETSHWPGSREANVSAVRTVNQLGAATVTPREEVAGVARERVIEG